MALAPRVVTVVRRTQLEDVLAQHPTRGQAEYFLRTRGDGLDRLRAIHDKVVAARRAVAAAVPDDCRRATVERADLGRFLFAPEDIVVVVGQDGLVANVAKYLDNQLVVGIDPSDGANPGVLVRHAPTAAVDVVAQAVAGALPVETRTKVAARLDDGQVLDALNEVFVGHAGHQSARYDLAVGGKPPVAQSSSGVIVGTGTGATGWCASLAGQHRDAPELPEPTSTGLAWFVREAWPSPTTDVSRTSGVLTAREELRLTIRSESLVVFGDGMEDDRLVATWGQVVTVTTADRPLRLA